MSSQHCCHLQARFRVQDISGLANLNISNSTVNLPLVAASNLKLRPSALALNLA